MAASLLSSLSFQRNHAFKASSFSSFLGKPKVRLHLSLKHLQKDCMHFKFLRCHQNCDFKLFRRPLSQKTFFGGLQHYPAKDFSKLNYASNDDCAPGGVLAPENSQKSMILDTSITGANKLDDFGKELQTLFIEVRTMLENGNKDDVVDLLQANYEIVKDQIDDGAKGIEQAAILDIVALGYVGVGDFKFVEHLLGLLTEIMGCVSDNTPLVDSILIHMGSMYTMLGKLKEARLVYERCLEILEDAFGRQSPFLVVPLLAIAKVFKLNGSITKAIESYHQAVDILERSRGADSEDLVLPLFCLGDIFINERRAKDAEASFRRIVTIYTKLYGEDDGRVGMGMCSLARAVCAKGDIGEAIDIYKKALQVIEDSKYMSFDDNILEKLRIELAELLHIAGREQEGRVLLEECLLITERYKGGSDPSLVSHLLNLASSYLRSKNYVEAERLLRMSLPIASKALGPGDPSIAVPMLHLAVILYYQRRDEEAERLAQEVLRIREDAFGKQSLPVGEALDCLVSIKTRMGKDDGEILSLLKRVLTIQEKELGYESEEVMTTLRKVIFFLDKMGKRDDKLPLKRRLSMLRAKHKQRVAT